MEHHGLAAGDVVLGVRDRTVGIISVGIIQHLIRLHRRFGGLRQLQRLIRLLIHHVAAQTGLVFARVICHIGIGVAPAAAHIGLDRERQDQLAAGPGDSTVLIGGLRHRVGCVVKALHSDGLAVGIYHRGNACKRLQRIPGIFAVLVLPSDLRILDRHRIGTACQPLREGEEVRQRVGQHRVRAGRHLGGAHVIGDGAESVFQLLGIVRREVVVAFRHAGAKIAKIPACLSEPICCRGIGIVGRHTVHVLVEVVPYIIGIRILKHTDGVHGHAVVLQIVGQIDSGCCDIVIKVIAVVGLTIGKDHHDLLGVLPGAGQRRILDPPLAAVVSPLSVQDVLRKGQAVVYAGGAGGLQRFDCAGQLLNARRIDGGKVLDDLCIVVGIIVVLAVVSDAVRVGVIRKLDNADSVGHVIVCTRRVFGHLINEAVYSALHGLHLGSRYLLARVKSTCPKVGILVPAGSTELIPVPVKPAAGIIPDGILPVPPRTITFSFHFVVVAVIIAEIIRRPPRPVDVAIRPSLFISGGIFPRALSQVIIHRPGDIQHQHNIQRCGLASLGHLVGDIGLQGQGIISVLIIVDRLVHHDAVVALCVDPVAPVAAARVFCRQGSSGNHCQHHTEDQKC